MVTKVSASSSSDILVHRVLVTKFIDRPKEPSSIIGLEYSSKCKRERGDRIALSVYKIGHVMKQMDTCIVCS